MKITIELDNNLHVRTNLDEPSLPLAAVLGALRFATIQMEEQVRVQVECDVRRQLKAAKEASKRQKQ